MLRPRAVKTCLHCVGLPVMRARVTDIETHCCVAVAGPIHRSTPAPLFASLSRQSYTVSWRLCSPRQCSSTCSRLLESSRMRRVYLQLAKLMTMLTK